MRRFRPVAATRLLAPSGSESWFFFSELVVFDTGGFTRDYQLVRSALPLPSPATLTDVRLSPCSSPNPSTTSTTRFGTTRSTTGQPTCQASSCRTTFKGPTSRCRLRSSRASSPTCSSRSSSTRIDRRARQASEGWTLERMCVLQEGFCAFSDNIFDGTVDPVTFRRAKSGTRGMEDVQRV